VGFDREEVGRRVEGGGWREEGGRWKVEGERWKVEGGGWKVEGGRRRWRVEGGSNARGIPQVRDYFQHSFVGTGLLKNYET
jgi:hypothetical protein